MLNPKMTLYEPNNKKYKNNGDYILDNEVFNQSVKWDLLKTWILTFDFPVNNELGIKFKKGQVIKTNTPKYKDQLFYIEAFERDYREWRVTAYHVSYKLKFAYVLDTFIQNKNAADAIEQLTNSSSSNYPFTGFTDKPEELNNARIVRMNALQAIIDESLSNSLVNRYNKEFIANNFEIQLLDRVGEDRGVDIRFGRDLIEIVEQVDYRDMLTAVQPIGFNGLTLPEAEGGPIVSIFDIPELEGTFDAELYHDKKIQAITFPEIKAAIGEEEFDEDAIPLESAYELLKEFATEEFTINRVHEPHVSYNLDFIALADYAQTEAEKKILEELQKIEPGDTIEVIGEDGTRVRERVVGYTFDPMTERYINLVLANRSPELTLQSEAERKLGLTVNNLEDLKERVHKLEREIARHLGILDEHDKIIEDLVKLVDIVDDNVDRISLLERNFSYDEYHNNTKAGGQEITFREGGFPPNSITSLGGRNNFVGFGSVAIGGEDNTIDEDSFVFGGKDSHAYEKSMILGGSNNDAVSNSVIIGGIGNRALGSPGRNMVIIGGIGVDTSRILPKNHHTKIFLGNSAAFDRNRLRQYLDTFEGYVGTSDRYYNEKVTDGSSSSLFYFKDRNDLRSLSGTITAYSPKEFNKKEDKIAVWDISVDVFNGLFLLQSDIKLRASRGDISKMSIDIIREEEEDSTDTVLDYLVVDSGDDKTMWQIQLDILTIEEEV